MWSLCVLLSFIIIRAAILNNRFFNQLHLLHISFICFRGGGVSCICWRVYTEVDPFLFQFNILHFNILVLSTTRPYPYNCTKKGEKKRIERTRPPPPPPTSLQGGISKSPKFDEKRLGGGGGGGVTFLSEILICSARKLPIYDRARCTYLNKPIFVNGKNENLWKGF